MPTPTEDIASHIAAQVSSPVDLVYDAVGANVFRGPPREPSQNQLIKNAVPVVAVFVTPTGGFDDIPYADGGLRGKQERPTFQIIVRGEPRDYDAAEDLAVAVHAGIDKFPPPGYFELRALATQPSFRRYDDEGRPEFVINALARRYSPGAP